MKYVIAIPSYRRSDVLVKKTLQYLLNTDVDPKCITVFVADKKERTVYDIVLKTNNLSVKLVVGVPTLRGQRAFIRKYYPKGTCVFSIDDDIEGIYHAPTSNNKDLKLVTKLNKFISDAFGLCKQFNISLWGTSAVLNAFFMHNKGVSMDLKYICGGAYGEVLDGNKKMDVKLEDKEDFERSIIHFIKCGKVLRYNEYALKTKGYQGAGGMQETRTKERVKKSAEFLLKKYPQYCKLNTGKKNQNFAEVKLIKQ
jgi:predicted transport protein